MTVKLATVFFLALIGTAVSRAEGLLEAALAQGFSERPIPQGDAWYAANRSEVTYRVSLNGQTLLIDDEPEQIRETEEVDRLYPQLRAYFRQEGYGYSAIHSEPPFTYIGYDFGEFGGGLVTVGDDGEPRTLLDENVADMRKIRRQLFVFTGLAHGVSNLGAIYQVLDPATDPRTSRFSLLPGEPAVVYSEGDSIYIVTYDGLVELNLILGVGGAEMRIHVANAFWQGLYPTTMVKDGSEILLGVRSGLAVLQLDNYGPPPFSDIRYLSRE